MPYTMKIQPIDYTEEEEPSMKCEVVAKPVFRSRFKWLFERPFTNGFRTLATDKAAGFEPLNGKGGLEELDLEPSSVCLVKMVQNFMEENNDKQQHGCGKNKCNCFNGNCTDSSDDELDSYKSSFSHACDTLKSLVPCVCVSERNLLADTAKIIERDKINERKDGSCRKTVADGLITLGYDTSICKSKWEKSPSCLAGEYEYLDVMMGGERLIIDIDFRSEFAIARPTKPYNLVLQTLPNTFIGKSDRLDKIIGIVAEAAKQSLKKRGMPIPPWRKSDYIKSKWLSPFMRITGPPETGVNCEREEALIAPVNESDRVSVLSDNNNNSSSCELRKWELPQVKAKSVNKGVKIVTGLASVIDNKP